MPNTCGTNGPRASMLKLSRSSDKIDMKAFFVQIKCELGKSYAVATAIADAEIARRSTQLRGLMT